MKILFIAIASSIHTARWIAQISDQGWDIHLIPSSNYESIHPLLKNITVHNIVTSHQKNINSTVKIKGFPLYFYYLASLFRRRILKMINPDYNILHIKNIIDEIKPDIIHSMEFQAAAYSMIKVKKIFEKEFPIWIATNWGSDIYYYQNIREHKQKIKEVLSNCDYYCCECERDIVLAKLLGLKGKELPLLSAGGGFDLENLHAHRIIKTSERKIILLKGYHGLLGRALVGLKALLICSREVSDYQIFVYSASSETEKEINKISESTNLKIKILPRLSHEEMLELCGKTRISIGLSISDGMPVSFLEALVMGAFPIQSNTSCADEWITDGESGFIVPAEDEKSVANAIKKALEDDDLVDNAALINWKIAKERLDKKKIKSQVIKMYQDISKEINKV